MSIFLYAFLQFAKFIIPYHEMYEETGFEPADDTPSPEEQMIRASEQNELKVRIQKAALCQMLGGG